jgi:hypothetical protein
MTAVKVGLLVLTLFSMPLSVGCDSGGGPAELAVEQSELQEYAKEHPEAAEPSYEGIE